MAFGANLEKMTGLDNCHAFLLEHFAAIYSKTATVHVQIYYACEMNGSLLPWISCAVLDLHNYILVSIFVPC